MQIKNLRIRELEGLITPISRSLDREFSSAKLSQNKKNDLKDSSFVALKEENLILKGKILSLTQELQRRPVEPRQRTTKFETKLSEAKLSESGHKSHRSIKRSVDVIRYENELRQKNRYIDSLLEKIKELQSGNREQMNKSALVLNQTFKKDARSIELPKDN